MSGSEINTSPGPPSGVAQYPKIKVKITRPATRQNTKLRSATMSADLIKFLSFGIDPEYVKITPTPRDREKMPVLLHRQSLEA